MRIILIYLYNFISELRDVKVRDKHLKRDVDVYCKDCPKYKCYWARPDPGVFIPGQGYRKAPVDRGYLCGNREIRGCPEQPDFKETRP